MFQFHPFGIVALVATILCWSLAVVLYRVGAPGSVARKLALLLGIEGMTLISSGYIDLMLTPAVHAHPLYQRWFDAEFVVHTLGDCSMLALYPPVPGRSPGDETDAAPSRTRAFVSESRSARPCCSSPP